MIQNPSILIETENATEDNPNKGLSGAQTLVRGLDIINAVALGIYGLNDLSAHLGLTRSTTHRLATTLVELRYLNFAPRIGYSLGPKLLELGYLAAQQMSLTRAAHDFIFLLSQETGDTVHLGIRDGDWALYLDKVSGRRRVEISSRIGDRHPLRSTGLGKALILDESEESLREIYKSEAKTFPKYNISEDDWVNRMLEYSKNGYAFDLEENEDRIRCVAAPIRDASGTIIGALSISSAAHYMDDNRMDDLVSMAIDTANNISSEIGWSGKKHKLDKTSKSKKSKVKS